MDRLSEHQEAKKRLIVALDFPSGVEAMNLVDRLDGTCQWFKVGMELYYAEGNAVIGQLRDRGYEVFLDLKLHDIPNTVAGAVRSAARTGASLLTVHASGGEEMMLAAAEEAAKVNHLRLLAVTVVTSMDTRQLAATGVSDAPGTQVLRLARLARKAGVGGLVCSAEEVSSVRDAVGEETLLVVPGIRPHGADIGDQRRIATPADAIERGASMLVVGRPVTRAKDPARAAVEILDSMNEIMLPV